MSVSLIKHQNKNHSNEIIASNLLLFVVLCYKHKIHVFGPLEQQSLLDQIWYTSIPIINEKAFQKSYNL